MIRKGENRIVALFPVFNLVLKFPRIRLWLAMKWVREVINTPEDWQHYLGKTVYHKSIKRCLFKGVVDNWKECEFYYKTNHPFLQPTYFSFFGLCNVQRYGQTVNQERQSFWIHLQKISNYEVTP